MQSDYTNNELSTLLGRSGSWANPAFNNWQGPSEPIPSLDMDFSRFPNPNGDMINMGQSGANSYDYPNQRDLRLFLLTQRMLHQMNMPMSPAPFSNNAYQDAPGQLGYNQGDLGFNH